MLVDTALAERESEGRPIRVALVGAGFVARGIAWQLLETPGMRLVSISARRPAEAEKVLRAAGVTEVPSVSSPSGLERAIASGRPAVTDDPALPGGTGPVDAVIEATSSVEFGSRTALAALEGGKHLVLVNADLDSLVGPILKTYADRVGVVVTGVGGEEHALAMNLVRYVRLIGLRPVLAGNIKGFLDCYRTPDTQRAFAESVGQRPELITAAADGTKLSMEATILANATGFGVSRRGMIGLRCEHVRDVLDLYPAEQLLEGGLVDFTIGAEPGAGAFVVAHGDDPRKRPYFAQYKLGDGPLHLFYQQHHLPNFEAPLTVARAVHFGDATVTPLGAPSCEVVTVAKRDLAAGETLDGVGGFSAYGAIDTAATSRAQDLLPIALSDGARLLVDVSKDRAISLADVERPAGRIADRLFAEQVQRFAEPAPAR
jgi:predicted homoserine dehydrogenase-like protein